jgi:prophage regulatory protein
MLKLIPHAALAAKGIAYSKVTLWRKERAGAFPRRVPVGASRYAYVEAEIDNWIAQRIADRDTASAA